MAEEAGLPAVAQGGQGWRRPRDARRRTRRSELRRRSSSRRSASRKPRSAARTCFWKSSSSGHGTSKCSCSATSTATWCTCSSAIARCSGAIRRWSKSPRRSNLEPRRCATRSAMRRSQIGREADYRNAGTVEFLVDADTEQVLLHRGQPANSGRAHRDRSGDRRRHREVPDPGGRRARRWPIPRSTWRTQADDPHAWLRPAVPRDDRRSRESVSAGLRPDRPLSLGRRHGRAARRRHGFLRRDDHAVLRLAAGEGHRLGTARFTDAARRMERSAIGVPHSRREDQHSVPDQPGHESQVPRRRVHDQVHRRNAGAVRPGAAAGSGHEAAQLPGRRDRQRPSAW